MSNESGVLVAGSVTRYLPYGGYRTAPTANLTDHPATSAGLRGYTGHKHNDDPSDTLRAGLGLIYMRARFYLPGLGRFASADTIVPDPASPQSYNRFAYALGNPLKFTDPSGHGVQEDYWTGGPGGAGGNSGLIETDPNIAWVRLSFELLDGWDLNLGNLDYRWVPYHVNHVPGDEQYPWEAAAITLYYEHRMLHPDHNRNRNDRKWFKQHWVADAVGIVQVMVNRLNNTSGLWPDYESINEIVGADGQFAYDGGWWHPQDRQWAESFEIAYAVAQVGLAVDPIHGYTFFAHQDLE